MAVALQISPHPDLFVKDPQTTDTGRSILRTAIPLMNELGFEKFTFKKLSVKMKVSEITIYRYFENKHKLLLYLLSWYWEWVRYSIIFNTRNIDSPEEILKKTIQTVVESDQRSELVEFVDEKLLFALVIEESAKAHHTKMVDDENKQGLFLTLKGLKSEIAEIIRRINKDYPYPNSLASTILDMGLNLRFYSDHLPSMGDSNKPENQKQYISDYLLSLCKKSLA